MKRRFGNGVRLAVLAICALAIGVSVAPAQFGGKGPPNQRPPGFNPPQQMEWFCNKCGHVLARGGPEPVHITRCPACGVRFINGGGGQNFDFNPPPPAPAPVVNNRANENAGTGRVVLFVIVGSVCFLMFVGAVGVVGLILLFGSGGSAKKRKRRRRRDAYDDD